MSRRSATIAVSLRRAAVCLAVGAALAASAAGTAATPAGAVTVSPECKDVVTQIGTDLKALVPATGSEKLTTAQVDAQKKKAEALFADAAKQHPSCGNDIANYGAQLAAAARKAGQIKGTPFLGPIGWAWNTVYYKVFSGNDIMMGIFGWALLLSPFILVFSVVWVMRGAQGAFRRPYVPPYLKTEQ